MCGTHGSEEITQMLKLGLISLVCFQLLHTGLQTLMSVSQSAHLHQSLHRLWVLLCPDADLGQPATREQRPVRPGLLGRRNSTRGICSVLFEWDVLV